jgi:hypothetical protein
MSIHFENFSQDLGREEDKLGGLAKADYWSGHSCDDGGVGRRGTAIGGVGGDGWHFGG